jgi:hypothetical protein
MWCHYSDKAYIFMMTKLQLGLAILPGLWVLHFGKQAP